MKHYWSIFRTALGIAFSNAAAYRGNFLLTTIIVFFGNILFPLVTILIYGSGLGFPGWTFYEVLLIQGLYTVSSGITGIFIEGLFWQTNISVREGTFELVLLKPINTIAYMTVSTIQLENGGILAGGLVITGLAAAKVGNVELSGIIGAVPLFIGGISVMLGMNLLMAATSFKWVGNSRIPELFNSALRFGTYPLSIFPVTLRGVLSFILPVASIGFFPAAALLGRIQWIHFAALLPCTLVLAAGISLYNRMIHHYEGVGG